MDIVKLTPATKNYIWGGNNLHKKYHKNSPHDTIAETWELSCHEDGLATICQGEFTGMSLKEYLKQKGPGALGENAARFSGFPVLVKLIDAKDSLSIQVHPSDDYALSHEGQYGKTEMWYILDCEKDAFLYYGLNQNTTPEKFRQAIENGTLTQLLHKVYVKPGEVYFIPSGTIHAIGAGITLAEVQQNSNLTYRVFDYNRVDQSGQSRELHIDKAVEVTHLAPVEIPPMKEGTCIGLCKYFKADVIEFDTQYTATADHKTFHHLLCLDGNGTISQNHSTKTEEQPLSFQKGDGIFVGANTGTYTITGKGRFLVTTVPEEEAL